MQYLAAVLFDDGQDIDGLLAAFCRQRVREGLRVRGVLQSRQATSGECHCSDMDLRAIGSGEMFRISQSLGSGSYGCRLHPGALAACSAYLEEQLEERDDLLLLNRFGKGESEGRGFRDLICASLALGTPVLLAVRPTYLEAWEQFSDRYGATLPFDLSAVEGWHNSLVQRHVA